MTDQSVADLYAGAPPSPQQGAQTLDELRELLEQACEIRLRELAEGATLTIIDRHMIGDAARAIEEAKFTLPGLLDQISAAGREFQAVWNEAVNYKARAEVAEARAAEAFRIGREWQEAAEAAEARADALAEALKRIIETDQVLVGGFNQFEAPVFGEGSCAQIARQALGARDEA